MESSSILPIIDLDGENSQEILLLAKSLGYFYIHRASSYGQIPNAIILETLIDELFSFSSESKFSVSSDYIRSTSINETASKHESLLFTSRNQVINFPRSMSIKNLLNICEQISIHLFDLFQLTDISSSSMKNTLALEHYLQTKESYIAHQNNDIRFQFHLFSTCDLQQLDSLEHEWKLIRKTLDDENYILVTFPNFLYRYLMTDTPQYMINYSCYHRHKEKRTYFLSLTQNTRLRYFTFFYLYAMQGITAGFSSTTLTNYLIVESEKSSTIRTFVSITNLSLTLQFIWGLLIDRFQSSSMGRRRPWIISSQICGFLASLGLLFVGNHPAQYIKTLVITFFIHSIFASIQDASVDAQAITTIPLNERGRLNGIMSTGFLLGSAVGGVGLSSLLKVYGYFTCAMIHSMFLLTFTMITIFIKEKSNDSLLSCSRKKFNKMNRRYEERDYPICKLFREFFKGLLSFSSLRLFIPILIIYVSQSAFIRAYNYHLISTLSWSNTSVSVLSGAWGTLIVICVALVGGWLADRIGARNLLVIVMIIHASYMLVANLIEPYWQKRSVTTTILILWNMMNPILSSASIPVLMSLCRKHVEGSQFTTYMSLVNLCDLTGAFFSGHLQRYLRANVIGLGCAILIIFAVITVSIDIFYDYRKKSKDNGKNQSLNGTAWKDCWSKCICTRYC